MRIVRIFQKKKVEDIYTEDELLSADERSFISKWESKKE